MEVGKGKGALVGSRCKHAMGIQDEVRARLQINSDLQAYLNLLCSLDSRYNGKQFKVHIPTTEIEATKLQT